MMAIQKMSINEERRVDGTHHYIRILGSVGIAHPTAKIK
jgi:hypothetical protein